MKPIETPIAIFLKEEGTIYDYQPFAKWYFVVI